VVAVDAERFEYLIQLLLVAVGTRALCAAGPRVLSYIGCDCAHAGLLISCVALPAP
jgi:hypothetical protein